MNIKTQIDRISNLIKSFKQVRQKSGPETFLPYSYDLFFESSETMALLNNKRLLMEIINTLPSFSMFNGKDLSHQESSINGYIRIYPNRYQENIFDVQSTDNKKVLLGMVKDDEFIDMRILGGGVKKKFIDEQNGLNMWLAGYSDIGRYDGIPTGLGQVVVIELPIKFKNTYEDVFKIAKKYLPAGIYPIIKFYGTIEFQELTIIANTNNYKVEDDHGHYFFVAGTPGKKFKVDWGDRTTSEITFTGLDKQLTKTYTTAGTYKVKMYGWNDVTKILWQNWNAGNFNLQDLPSGLTHLDLSSIGTNLTGNIDNLPSGLTYLRLDNVGANITGSLNNLPSGINTTLYLYQLGTNLTGNIGSLNANISNIYIKSSGNNFDLTTSLKAFNNANITIAPQSGYGYTTAQIDAFLNAYDAVAGTGHKTIDLRGANQPRSSASDAAVISLTSKGRAIYTNP